MIPKRSLHIKRVPKFYGNQLSKFKYSQDIPTHELLARLGFITYPRSGLVNWTKLGLSMQDKLSNIIRKRMDEIGFEELSLSLISHRKLWEDTGRWEGSEIFKLVGDEYLLVPTAEEEITDYVNKQLESYKQLPVCLYQINPKFRNEKRPRGGLLRGKEFLMKDAYSFDLDESNAMVTYEKVVGAYHKIFQDLRIPYVKAQADSGDIGGSLSHEWHYINESGEDTVFKCSSCNHASNVEKTLSFPKEVDESSEILVKYFTTKDKSTLVCAYYPSNRVLEPKFIQNEITDLDLTEHNQDELLDSFSNKDDLSKRFVRIMDARLSPRSNLPDFPLNFSNRAMITTLTDVPLVLAQEGEICAECEDGEITATNAIEVGHTFYLGDKYSAPLNCAVDVPTETGMTRQTISMGCYGIGISRIIAAIGEINRDAKGLSWPKSISPWDVTVVEIGQDEERSKEVFKLLNHGKVDYCLDDRDVSMGKKLKESGFTGIPLSIILGKHYPIVEIEVRGKKYGDTWKHTYEKHKDEFDWKVQYDNEQVNDVKHFVHKDGLVTVVNSLLNDM
ncbi:PRS Proline--tRNA ligase [Candida maltosa Xu316]|uniref:proline--tRNA ligase n=1 Tax=Candida maltosa (strain Xu316) TaxID=1245528 RepID=M3IR58_CANMX|nr:Prolyl-tRNA synthetase [Candida maltosa Xu316]